MPDHRNRDRQKYCKRAICRKASKSASQAKWLNKPENKNYFQGPLNFQRVQVWRKQNPGYWKPKSSNKGIALQEDIAETLLRMQQSGQVIISKDRILKLIPPVNSSLNVPRDLKLEVVERNHIIDVLKKTAWRVSGEKGAANLLGLKPTTLQSRMKKMDITRPT